MFTDIKNSDQFETVQKVAKGWSSDEKYFIQTREQQRLLLRVSDVAHSSLYSIKWAEKFGQEDIDGMVRRYHKAFEDYEGFRTVIPKWYTDQLSSGSPNAASRARLTRSGV